MAAGVGLPDLRGICRMTARIAWACAAFFVLFPITAEARGPRATTPQVNVTLLADREAAAPGATLRVGVRYEIKPGWHIYWASGGEPGAPALPTHVSLEAPPGFTVKGPHFPTPDLYESSEGNQFVLEGEPVVLFEATAPADLKGETVAFRVETKWLVCKESCLPGSAKVDLTLPVVATAADAKPANEKRFEEAEEELPTPAEKAGYVKLRGGLSQDRVRPGDSFEALLTVEIKAGHHIQARQTLNESLIPTYVFLAPTEGLEFEDIQYPAGKKRTVPVLGTVSEYGGTTTIRIPAKAEGDLQGERTAIRGVFQYQACADSGTCYPPEKVAFSIDVPLAKRGEAIQLTTAAPDEHASEPTEGPSVQGAGAVGVSDGGADGDAGGATAWAWVLISLFVGGMILNIMPCVLPVISIKVLSFVKQAGESRGRIFQHGMIFSLGIVASFLGVAATVVALKIGGESVGWGFLSQSAWFNLAMTTIVFAFALSLLGVWEINLPGRSSAALGEFESREGAIGTFLKGILATVLAIPCLGPFLGTAIAYTLARPPVEIIAYFGVMGLGMAFPYILLAAYPAWLRFIPRPGPWMNLFKEAMGFLLLLTVLFLLVVVSQQLGDEGFARSLGLLLSVAIGCWLFGRISFTATARRKAVMTTLALVMAGGGGWASFSVLPPLEIEWREYKIGDEVRLAEEGFTVYVDFTATWCLTCQFNKRYLFTNRDILRVFKENNVFPLKCDWTNQDPAVLERLMMYDRAGVPLNIIVPAGRPRDVIVLPEQLVGRSEMVLEKLKAAGPSRQALPPYEGPSNHNGKRLAAKK